MATVSATEVQQLSRSSTFMARTSTKTTLSMSTSGQNHRHTWKCAVLRLSVVILRWINRPPSDDHCCSFGTTASSSPRLFSILRFFSRLWVTLWPARVLSICLGWACILLFFSSTLFCCTYNILRHTHISRTLS